MHHFYQQFFATNKGGLKMQSKQVKSIPFKGFYTKGYKICH